MWKQLVQIHCVQTTCSSGSDPPNDTKFVLFVFQSLCEIMHHSFSKDWTICTKHECSALNALTSQWKHSFSQSFTTVSKLKSVFSEQTLMHVLRRKNLKSLKLKLEGWWKLMRIVHWMPIGLKSLLEPQWGVCARNICLSNLCQTAFEMCWKTQNNVEAFFRSQQDWTASAVWALFQNYWCGIDQCSCWKHEQTNFACMLALIFQLLTAAGMHATCD